ncbi:hypothetical protein [Streptomyces sp. NRRL S-646]|uniref:hypothetical protein n=1 Tax=Streptomyces sp. NRRL S-646 TaxID=1463917 RepID=UPI0004C7976C|nr:hypothetical protein [Streptomyces sp. NRRL S-646]
MNILKRAAVAVASVALMTGAAGIAFADQTPPPNGQPGASCEDPSTSTRPGHASTAPGSAFNPTGVSGTKYAGEQPQNSKNPKSVSQYDVACFQVSNH